MSALSTKSFNNILSKIIKSESGIKKVILVDRTGLTIAHVSKFSYYPVDVDGIGAIASAVFCASEEQGKNLELGNLRIADIRIRFRKNICSFVWKRSIVLNFGCGSQPRVNPLSLKTRWRRITGHLR